MRPAGVLALCSIVFCVGAWLMSSGWRQPRPRLDRAMAHLRRPAAATTAAAQDSRGALISVGAFVERRGASTWTGAWAQPLRLVDRRGLPVHNRVKAARLSLLLWRAVQLDFVSILQMQDSIPRGPVGVKEDSRVGLRLTTHDGDEFEVAECLLPLGAIANEEEVAAAAGRRRCAIARSSRGRGWRQPLSISHAPMQNTMLHSVSMPAGFIEPRPVVSAMCRWRKRPEPTWRVAAPRPPRRPR